MPYSPPEFNDLYDATCQLEKSFSAISERYQSSNLSELLASVKKDILSKNYNPRSDHRKQQIDVFRNLYNELIKLDDETKEQDALQFMLGALIHRYFRIIAEYTTRPDSQLIGLFRKPQIEKCGLFQALVKVLGISEKNNVLDALTIVTCCQCFLENMQADNRYLNHPHFKHDPNFFSNVKDIIASYQSEAQTAIEQLEFINFLDSMARQIKAVAEHLESECLSYLEQLKTKHPDFKQLNFEHLIEALSGIQDENARNRMEQLLRSPHISENLNTSQEASAINDYDTLKKYIMLCLQARSQFALFGAYILVLDQAEQMKDLKQTLKLALNSDKTKAYKIDPTTAIRGIKVLETWIINRDEKYQLDCTSWGGKYEVFKAKVIAHKAHLMTMMEEDVEKQSATL